MGTKQVVLLAVVGLTLAVVGYFAFEHWAEAEALDSAAAEAAALAADSLVRGDPGEALRLAAEGLREHPGSVPLLAVRIRAFCARGRFGDALADCETAREKAEDDAEIEEIEFLKARARLERYLETGERDDLNLAEVPLRDAAAGGRFAGAAKLLLGLGLAKRAESQAEAAALLEEGLRDPDAQREIGRTDRAREVLRTLQGGK